MFSSPYVAFLISKYQKLSEEFMFSSPHGAYLISILSIALNGNIFLVFVPSRGISNLNVKLSLMYYAVNLFSSPPGAYLISINALNETWSKRYKFSSPPGAYLISINSPYGINRETGVFVPSRGISNLNVCVVSYQEDFSEFSSHPGAYLISMEG